MQRKRAGYIALALSLLPISNGVQHYLSVQPFLETAISADAIVVRNQPTNNKSTNARDNALYPVVSFTDDSGRKALAQTNVGSYPAARRQGELLSILYDPTNSLDIRENSFMGLHFEIAFYLVPGILTFLLGLFLVFSTGRKRRNAGVQS
ncbi:MAG: DUF3592 domain-containing protein [Granulosicoccus sp.]